MKNKIIIITILIIISIVTLLIIIMNPKESDKYTIKVKLIDDYSPDVELIVFKNEKEFKDYKYIKYVDSKTVICNSNSPVVNKYEINEDNYIIVLKDNKEVTAEIVKE